MSVVASFGRFAYSRPTAVNLQDASHKLSAALDAAAGAAQATAESVTTAAITFAETMMEADIANNRSIGMHGMHAILSEASARGLRGGDKLRLLTHCNTGSLATVQYGTALGCIRALHESGKLERAFCTETRCAPVATDLHCMRAASWSAPSVRRRGACL
jgi:methylthioribose-1-phosphate isomerase